MKGRTFIIALITFFASHSTMQLMGQNGESSSPYEISLQSFSPQVEGMKRFDQLKTPLHNGLANLHIPLITYKDQDFEFPLSLQYDSQGFKPADFGNYVGLNWILSGGGVIYREIMGISDDTYAYRYEYKEKVKGFLHIYDRSRNPLFTSVANKEEVLREPEKYLQVLPWSNVAVIQNTDSIEASSDIYHFSFGKHSGKFLIGYDGSVNVISHTGGKYKVDLSDYHFSFTVAEGGLHQVPSIRITTDDGYTYTFGGTYASLEYMALSWITIADVMPNYERMQRITAFHLTQITAPNGRTLYISYINPFKDDTYHNFPDKLVTDNIEKLKAGKYHHTYILNASPFQYYAEPFSASNNDNPLRTNLPLYKKHILNKISLINSIHTDAGSIDFYYGDREKTLFDPNEDTDFGAACGAKLDSILFKANGQTKQRIHLTYQYPGNRMLLNSIYDSQIGTYKLNYYSGPTVSPFTIDIDHWEYWNGAKSNLTLIPDLDYSELPLWIEGPITKYRSNNREPTGRDFNAFLLKTIEYPTGGYTEYIYEPHDYEQYIDQKNGSYNLALYGSISGNQKGKLAGGARVQRIIHHSITSPKQIISYQYTEDRNTQQSSGILLKRKPLYIYGILPDPTIPTDYHMISYRSDGHQAPTDYISDYIAYKRIAESQTFVRDSSKIITIAPLDDVRLKAGTIPFGSSSRFDIQNYQWTIQGTGRPEHPGVVILNIHGSKKSEKKEIRFTTNIIQEIEKNKVIIHPIEEYGEGTIDFYIDALEDEFIRMDITMTVLEKPERGYKEYLFTNFSSNPDYEYRTIIPPGDLIRNPLNLPFLAYYGKKVLDHSQERGLLKTENSYNREGELVQSIQHLYERKNYDNYEISVFSHPVPYATHDQGWGITAQLGSIHQVFKVPLYTYLPKENITTTYNSEGNRKAPFITQEILTHDINGYLKKKENRLHHLPDTASYFTEYRYAFEETGEPYDSMKALHILSPVTLTRSYNTEHTLQEISATKYNYQLVDNLLPSTPNACHKQAVIRSIETGRSLSGLEQRVQHLKFDLYGNPIYMVKDSLTHLVYLWSYEGQYPIAHIEGATYEEVKRALGDIPPENLSSQEQPDESLLTQLRENLPSAQVYTFIYKPFTGIIRQTDPKGFSTYYDYDDHNRLKEIYLIGENGEKEIITHYQYSFK